MLTAIASLMYLTPKIDWYAYVGKKPAVNGFRILIRISTALNRIGSCTHRLSDDRVGVVPLKKNR
jgi:hypothetical protein